MLPLKQKNQINGLILNIVIKKDNKS